MEEMEGFKRQFEELIKRVENIDEVGCLELTAVEKELNSLKSRAGISANSFAHDTENDITDIRDVLNAWNELDDRIIEVTMRVDLKHQARWELAQREYANYKLRSEYKRENQKRINEYKFELDKHKALLNHISDPFAKDNMEDTIKDDEKHIQRAEELNERYDKELYDYSVIIRTLLEGGKLPKLDKIDEEEMLDEINRDNERREEDKPKKKTEAKEDKPKKVSVKRDEVDDEKNLNLVNPIKEEEEDEDKAILPPIIGPSVKRDEEDEDKKVLPPIFEEIDEEEDEDKKVLPPTFEEIDEEENKKVLPPTFEETLKEVEEEEEEDKKVLPPTFEEIDEDLDEELEPVAAKVKPPKDALWKKVGKAIGKAVLYLSALATAVHTGLILHGINKDKPNTNSKEETVEETQINTKEEEKEKEDTKDDKTSKTEEPQKMAEVTPTEAKTEEKKEEPKKEEPAKEEPKEEETLSIRLNPGETVYNTDTGVEVGYNGNAAHVDTNGTVHEEADRNLEHNQANQAIVTNNDLNQKPAKETPAINNERTGYEMSEEEAKAKMSEEEKAVASQTEDEWFKWLEEEGLSR